MKYLELMSGLVVEGSLTVMIKNINESIRKIEMFHKTRTTCSTEQLAEIK